MVNSSDIVRGTRFGELFDKIQHLTPVNEITRISEISITDFLAKFARKSSPFILSAGGAPVSVLQKIVDEFGEAIIKVRLGDYANPFNYAPERRQFREMKIKEYFDLISQSSLSSSDLPPYAGNFTLPIDFLKSIGAGAPVFYPSSTFEAPTVWLGAKGSLTPLHRDSTDNFVYQILGQKRWVIFPPHDAPYLYMKYVAASVGGDFATSDVDLRNPDLLRFPEFVKTKPIEFILSEGEMLYLPMGWAHFVENLSESLMVNYWRSVKPSGVAALE